MAGKLPSMKLKAVVYESEVGSDDDDHYEDDAETGLDLSLDKLNLGPRKKLLVLCLGGLLVDRVFVRNSRPNSRRPDGIAGNFLVFNRPYVVEFMKFCFERFEVGIWSSARKHNIDDVLSIIMKGLKDKLRFVWSQEECTNSGFNSLVKKRKPLFLKDLSKLWDRPRPSLPWDHGRFSSSNTLLIDDDPSKALLDAHNNAIFPDLFKVSNRNDTVLGPNGELQLFLDGLVDADDVRTYVKEHRIGQPAITEFHSDWDYYSKIVRKFRPE